MRLKNHPGMMLRNDAAASLERFERDHGVQPITSAWRSEASQQALIDRYDRPTSIYDRPPYLYNPRRPASAGLHVAGIAIDTSAPEAFHADGERYGFRFLYPYDKVHFEYNPAYDTKPQPVKAPEIKETLEMAKPTLIESPSGQFVSVGGRVANLGNSQNVKDFTSKNDGKYDKIWLPDSVVRELRS